jgi:hypothetical protein
MISEVSHLQDYASLLSCGTALHLLVSFHLNWTCLRIIFTDVFPTWKFVDLTSFTRKLDAIGTRHSALWKTCIVFLIAVTLISSKSRTDFTYLRHFIWNAIGGAAFSGISVLHPPIGLTFSAERIRAPVATAVPLCNRRKCVVTSPGFLHLLLP